MEPSTFINQTRLSQNQLKLHFQQQQQHLNQQQQHQHQQQQQQQNFYLDSPIDHKYQQHHPPRCQYYPSPSSTTPITSPSLSHFPLPPPEYPPPSLIQQQHNFNCDFNQQQQLSPSHCRTNTKKHHQTQDPNSIEICMDYQMNQQQNNQMNYVGGEQSIKWNRNNITATMEKYEPKHHQSPKHHQMSGQITSLKHNHQPSNNTSSTHSHDYLNEIHHQDYAYAYYEPGMAMRHQNIPRYYDDESSTSKPPPPNSMRALLSTTRKNKNGQKYVYNGDGTVISVQSHPIRNQENVYEEINDDEKLKRLKTGSSIISLNHNMVEEEFRRVQNRHNRILGELNLSVEEMLMPPTINPALELSNEVNAMDFLGISEVTDGSGAVSSINVYNNNIGADLDSGFSGSNSSYIGNMRYHKTMQSPPPPAPAPHIHHLNTGSFYSNTIIDQTDDIGMISLSSRSSSSLFDSGKKSNKINIPSPSMSITSDNKSTKGSFWKSKAWRKIPGFSSTTSINKIDSNDEQKPISWEDPLPRSNSISSTTNSFNPQSVARKSNNSIITLPNRQHNSYNLNTLNNNHQETSFYNPSVINNNNSGSNTILNINSILNNNHLINNNSPIIGSNNLLKPHKKLEHTPSARTISSEDSWCSGIHSEDHDIADDVSSFNDEEDNLSDRSTSLIANTRNSQLRLTFNKAKQHLSFDKWRNHHNTSISSNNSNNSNNTTASNTMPTSATNQESPGESLSRLSRWFSIRRGSAHQYDLNGTSNNGSPLRSGSVDKSFDQSDEKTSNGRKMPQLQETDEDSNHINHQGQSQIDGAGQLLSNSTRIDRRTAPLVLPPPPANLTQQQLKRRHIITAIVHSENSYVATLQRLVNDYKKPLEDSNPPILNNSKIAILFHRLPEILQCHTLFRIALTECIRNWDRDEKIGDVFIGAFSKSTVLDVYSGFINNFSNAMELAKMEAKRKSALADFFNVKQISAHDRLSFFGLMVKPVQRFPQFILFLQDLLKYTPQGHHDRMSLQLALTQLESLAEMLNERKREAEQYQAYKEMLGQISGTFNTRFLSSHTSADQRHNYLLREDNVTQLEFNQSGNLMKSKQRRLILSNDKVICVSVAPKQSQDFGSTEKLSFKWMYHINDVEIVDNTTSATLNRFITCGLNRGGSLKSNHSGSGSEFNTSNNSNSIAAQLTNGAENLANEMSSLMHDYTVMSRVNDLVGQLKGEYQDINLNVVRNVLNTIQTSIKKKDEEMAWVDSCCLQLVLKQKSGKEETLTFRTENPMVKKEWITELRLAQLALDTSNAPAWEHSDRDNHRPLTKMPLFVRMHPVYKSTQHQTEVRCGCYYSMSQETKFRKATKNRYYLWVCSVDGASSHISVLMHQPHQSQAMIKDVTAFSLNETVITTMDFVKGKVTLDGTTSCCTDLDCVWIGTSNKKLVVYAATNPEQEKQIAQLSIPGIPTQILYHNAGDSVFVALSTGDVLLFRKTADGEMWNFKQYQIIMLENSQSPITSVLSINSNIYVASGRKVFVLNGITGDVQKNFDIQHSNNDVNLMAHAGIGLWISLKNSSIICLYHTETFKHLQDINISQSVLRVTSSQRDTTSSNGTSSSVYVTALMACKGLLWVGTNVGITLTVPLPRLEGVPIISGGVNISYHAHFGPVTFFLPLITKSAHHSPSTPVQQKALPAADDTNNNTEVDNKNIKKKVEEEEVVGIEKINKFEKQQSLDIPVIPTSATSSPKNKSLLSSPIVLRRKSQIKEFDMSRISKTLPRGFSGVGGFFNGTASIHSNSSSGSSQHGSDHGCDVYGLYSDLLFVKEDFDGVSNANNMIMMEQPYECLRRSDPDLAAIPSKVSTLDRRLKMKVSRPRSLDLSNWSVDSRSSSLYTSSGSEESMGIKHYRSVSRNSSNASHKFNGPELMNINEVDHHPVNATSTPAKIEVIAPVVPVPVKENGLNVKETPATAATVTSPTTYNSTTMKNNKRKNLKNNCHQQMVDGRRTVLTLMGGRGYINWRHVWYNSPAANGNTNTNSGGNAGGNTGIDGGRQSYHLRSNSMTNYKLPNSTDAHIIIWEKKL